MVGVLDDEGVDVGKINPVSMMVVHTRTSISCSMSLRHLGKLLLAHFAVADAYFRFRHLLL